MIVILSVGRGRKDDLSSRRKKSTIVLSSWTSHHVSHWGLWKVPVTPLHMQPMLRIMVSDVVKWLTKWSPAHLSFATQYTIHLNYLRSGKHTLCGILCSCESSRNPHCIMWAGKCEVNAHFSSVTWQVSHCHMLDIRQPLLSVKWENDTGHTSLVPQVPGTTLQIVRDASPADLDPGTEQTRTTAGGIITSSPTFPGMSLAYLTVSLHLGFNKACHEVFELVWGQPLCQSDGMCSEPAVRFIHYRWKKELKCLHIYPFNTNVDG